jgi:hypothetical protein
MRNLILFLIIGLPILVFGQNLNDVVNFDSLNKDLINNELYKKISKIRKQLNLDQIVKDTVPIYAAKYHLTYFKQHKDLSEIHNENKVVKSDLYGRGYIVHSSLLTPEIRLDLGERTIKYPGVWMEKSSYNLIEERTFSYNLNKTKSITYNDLIENIYIDLSNSKLLNALLNENNLFGFWNECVTEDENIIFAISYVLTFKTII